MTETNEERDRLRAAAVDAYNHWLEVRPEWFGKPLPPNGDVPTMPRESNDALSAYYEAQAAYDDFVKAHGWA